MFKRIVSKPIRVNCAIQVKAFRALSKATGSRLIGVAAEMSSAQGHAWDGWVEGALKSPALTPEWGMDISEAAVRAFIADAKRVNDRFSKVAERAVGMSDMIEKGLEEVEEELDPELDGENENKDDDLFEMFTLGVVKGPTFGQPRGLKCPCGLCQDKAGDSL